jgi:capsular exopolysaccharide synthesis family protein
MKDFKIKEENYIIELYKKVYPYRLSIILFGILFFLLGKAYLYFKPSIYESYAIVKVKAKQQEYHGVDILRENLSLTNTTSVEEELALLKTYQINKLALEKVNFQIQYFKEEGYKKVELYKDTPIKIRNITNINPLYIGKLLTIETTNNGFKLYSDTLSNNKVYPFDTPIKTPFFSAEVNKLENFKKLYIRINGDNRSIFESYIQPNLDITQVKEETNLLKINYMDTIQERANDYVNALIQGYIEKSIKNKEHTNNKILNFLTEELANAKKKLDESATKLQKYRTENSVDPQIKSQDSFRKLSNIELELTRLKLQEKLIKNSLRFIKRSKNLNAITPTLVELNEQPTIQLINLLQTLEERRDDLRLEYTDRYPELNKIIRQIQRTRNKILQNIKRLKHKIALKIESLSETKSKYEKTLTTLPTKEKDLIYLQQDYELNLKTYNYLLERKAENEFRKVATASDYEQIDPAYGSNIPVRPKRLVFLLLATLAGLAFGIMIALLRSRLISKVESKKEITHLTKIPFYAMIPLYEKGAPFTIDIKEAYHKLALNLQFHKKEEEGNIVVISSYEKGEGKTTTLVNLAASLNNLGLNLILVDFNLKEPALHTYFGLGEQYSGISTFLSQRDNIGNIIYTTNYPNLDLITAGPIPPNPTELLLSPNLLDLFMFLKEKYDYILIDTYGYSEGIEILSLMKYSDTNLIVVRENFSKKRAIEEIELIKIEKNIKNLGIVYKYKAKNNKKLKEYKAIPIPKNENKPKYLL